MSLLIVIVFVLDIQMKTIWLVFYFVEKVYGEGIRIDKKSRDGKYKTSTPVRIEWQQYTSLVGKNVV